MADLLFISVADLFSPGPVQDLDGVETILSGDFLVLTSLLPGDVRDGYIPGQCNFLTM